MDIFLTFDYELYFGPSTGSVAKCLLEPTRLLMNIAERYKIKLTFFIDCGYLIALEKFKSQYPGLEEDYKNVTAQIRALSDAGHGCELHIHPHWEDTVYNGQKWVSDVRRYKLSDFKEGEVLSIFQRYHETLFRITGKKSHVYRAGGWSLQPFTHVRKAFHAMSIRVDSTVFEGGYLNEGVQYFDFRNTPGKDSWMFEDDLCVESPSGSFRELPISSMVYSPFFFWKLYTLGRLFPAQHKPFGDGVPASAAGSKWKYLTGSQRLPVSTDGYFALTLSRALNELKQKQSRYMVVIGHPKACTGYSVRTMEKFIMENISDHRFISVTA